MGKVHTDNVQTDYSLVSLSIEQQRDDFIAGTDCLTSAESVDLLDGVGLGTWMATNVSKVFPSLRLSLRIES